MTRKLRKNHRARAAQILGTALPSAIVWILTGLWHGTGVDYLLWGCYWGVIIIISSILDNWLKRMKGKCIICANNLFFRLFQVLRTFGIYCIGISIVAPGSMSALKNFMIETVHKCVEGSGGAFGGLISCWLMQV